MLLVFQLRISLWTVITVQFRNVVSCLHYSYCHYLWVLCFRLLNWSHFIQWPSSMNTCRNIWWKDTASRIMLSSPSSSLSQYRTTKQIIHINQIHGCKLSIWSDRTKWMFCQKFSWFITTLIYFPNVPLGHAEIMCSIRQDRFWLFCFWKKQQ